MKQLVDIIFFSLTAALLILCCAWVTVLPTLGLLWSVGVLK